MNRKAYSTFLISAIVFFMLMITSLGVVYYQNTNVNKNINTGQTLFLLKEADVDLDIITRIIEVECTKKLDGEVDFFINNLTLNRTCKKGNITINEDNNSCDPRNYKSDLLNITKLEIQNQFRTTNSLYKNRYLNFSISSINVSYSDNNIIFNFTTIVILNYTNTYGIIEIKRNGTINTKKIIDKIDSNIIQEINNLVSDIERNQSNPKIPKSKDNIYTINQKDFLPETNTLIITFKEKTNTL